LIPVVVKPDADRLAPPRDHQRGGTATREYWVDGISLPPIEELSAGDFTILLGGRTMFVEVKASRPTAHTKAAAASAELSQLAAYVDAWGDFQSAQNPVRVLGGNADRGQLKWTLATPARELTPRMAVLDSSAVSAIDRAIERYEVVNRDAIANYLVRHSELLKPLAEAPSHLDRAFGGEVRLELLVDREPEGGEPELIVRVVSPLDWRKARAAMDAFDDKWWLDTSAVRSGYLSFVLE
jgi:hypothetical protein